MYDESMLYCDGKEIRIVCLQRAMNQYSKCRANKVYFSANWRPIFF
jgi:hypothetical protein